MEMDNNSVNLKTTIGHNTLSKISFNDEEVYFSYYDKDSSPWGLIDFLNRYLSKMPLITSISLHQEPGEFCFVIYNNKLYYFDDYNKGGFNFKYPKLLKNGISYLSENALDNIQEFENFIDIW